MMMTIILLIAAAMISGTIFSWAAIQASKRPMPHNRDQQ